MIFQYFLVIATLFFMIFFYFSIRDSFKVVHPRTKTFTKPDEKLKVLDEGENLQIEGGELEPDFYYKFVQKLQEEDTKEIRIEFICGPNILVESKHQEALGGNKGKTKNMQEYHPLFKFAHEYRNRLTIFLRISRDEPDIHYSVGSSARLICEEKSHPRGSPKTGVFYYNDVPRWQILKKRIEQNKGRCIVWNEEVEVPFETIEVFK